MSENESENIIRPISINQIVYSLNTKENTAFIIKNNYASGDILIPSLVIHDSHEYIVTTICSLAFNDTDYIKSIRFKTDSKLQKIERNAFSSSSIQSIIIPSSLVELEEGWCNKTPNLSKITVMPNNLYYKSYEDRFILKKSNPENENFDVLVSSVHYNIKTIMIPNFIKIIGSFAFEGCEQLQEVYFQSDSKLQKIEKYGFSNSSIEKLSIPKNLTEINEKWCFDTPNLNEISIDKDNHNFVFLDDKFIITKSNKESDEYDVIIFARRNIKDVTIPSFVKRIGECAFNRCHNLKNVHIPNDSKLQIIDKDAFTSSSIESINFPPHLKIICKNAFCSCNELKNVEIPENSELQIIDQNAFSATSIESIFIPPHLTKICQNAFISCIELKCVKIPENSELQVIENDAFNESSIESIFIPSKLFILEEDWCSKTPNLTKINVSPNNPYYKSYEDKFILGKSNKENDVFDVLIFAVRDIEIAKIPNFIKIIGPNSFDECKKLKTIEFSDDSELEIIDKSAFFSSSIESINIQPHVKKICQFAFSFCKNIKKFEIPKNSELQVIEKEAFSHSLIGSIRIPFHLKEIHKFAFSFCVNLKKIEIPINSELQTIEERAFHFTSIDSITIPAHLSYIGKFAFNSCKQLIKIEIPPDSNLQIIDQFAFGSSSIEKIRLPSNLKEIDEYAFFFCQNLRQIEIPNDSKLQIIKKSAFHRLSIESIMIPRHIKQIDDFAFSHCLNLQIIEFAENSEIENINEKMFDCSKNVIIMIPVKFNNY